jgi:dUTP pyrophosphatase
MELGIKLIHPKARIPVYNHEGDSGADVYAIQDVLLNPGMTAEIKTGIILDIPPGYEIQVRSRSGLALKTGVIVLNSPGTVDSSYKGELVVILNNTARYSHNIQEGDRIAQIVLQEVKQARFVPTAQLSDSTRKTNGFGSTGQ